MHSHLELQIPVVPTSAPSPKNQAGLPPHRFFHPSAGSLDHRSSPLEVSASIVSRASKLRDPFGIPPSNSNIFVFGPSSAENSPKHHHQGFEGQIPTTTALPNTVASRRASRMSRGSAATTAHTGSPASCAPPLTLPAARRFSTDLKTPNAMMVVASPPPLIGGGIIGTPPGENAFEAERHRNSQSRYFRDLQQLPFSSTASIPTPAPAASSAMMPISASQQLTTPPKIPFVLASAPMNLDIALSPSTPVGVVAPCPSPPPASSHTSGTPIPSSIHTPARCTGLNLLHVSVMLVEDSAINNALMVRLLRSMGFATVVSVSNAEEGLQKLHELHFAVHLILTDIHLSDKMDGIEFASRVRQLRETSTLSPQLLLPTSASSGSSSSSASSAVVPATPKSRSFSTPTTSSGPDAPLGSPHHRIPIRWPIIIGVSGASETETIHACRQADMDAFLTKPVARSHLSQLLSRWFGVCQPTCVTSPDN